MAAARTTRIVRSLRNGQITIPAEFRRQLGIQDESLLQVTLDNGELRIAPLSTRQATGSPWLRDLYELFAPVREEAAHMSEDEINDAIDAAVQAVRRALVANLKQRPETLSADQESMAPASLALSS